MKINELKTKQIGNIQYGDSIAEIVGKVEQCEALIVKTGKDGNYNYQKCKVSDETGTISVHVYKHQDWSQYVGKTVLIKATPFKQYTQGLSVNTFKEHNYVRVDSRATITVVGESASPVAVNAPVAHDQPKNGGRYDNNRHTQASILTDYVTDLVIAQVNNGVEVDIATNTSIASVQKIFTSMVDYMDGKVEVKENGQTPDNQLPF